MEGRGGVWCHVGLSADDDAPPPLAPQTRVSLLELKPLVSQSADREDRVQQGQRINGRIRKGVLQMPRMTNDLLVDNTYRQVLGRARICMAWMEQSTAYRLTYRDMGTGHLGIAWMAVCSTKNRRPPA